jgi:hypothetical protein
LNLTSCTANSGSKFQFDYGRIPTSEWAKEENDCRYEAKKAVAGAPVSIAGYREDRLFVLCLVNKGAIYEGEID